MLAFDVKLRGADLARVINAYDEFQLAGQPPPAVEPPKGSFLSRAAGSRLDGVLVAQGRFWQPFSFHGDGHLLVTGKKLGEIHLLGALSELLSKTLLNFTSLRIETAQAPFKLDGNKVHFPQLKLLGPSASIVTNGDYLLDAKTLDFNARVYPLQESKLALPYGLGLLLAPLSSVLELKLTGPFEKPSWVFVYGPTNILRFLTQPSTGGAPPPLTPPSALPPSSVDQAPPPEKSLPRNPG
jgi:hypothetical protein